MDGLDPDELALSGAHAVCVMLSTADEPAAERLEAVLRDRHVTVVGVRSPVDAMTELCVQERMQQARSAWGLQRSARLSLFVTERDRWLDLSSMLDAITMYLPDTAVWMMDDGVAVQVRPAPRAPMLRLSRGEDFDGPQRSTVQERARSTMDDRASPTVAHETGERRTFGDTHHVGADPEVGDPCDADLAEAGDHPSDPLGMPASRDDDDEPGHHPLAALEETEAEQASWSITSEELRMLLERDRADGGSGDDDGPHTAQGAGKDWS